MIGFKWLYLHNICIRIGNDMVFYFRSANMVVHKHRGIGEDKAEK